MKPTMNFHRQMGIISPEELEETSVTAIGAGGIGNPAIVAMAKMGIKKITVYDDDVVEPHNLPNQLFFGFSDIGRLKVDAIALKCQELAGVEIIKKPEKFTDQELSGIVISAVDSMDVRKDIWNKTKYNINVPLYIEARMGAEIARVYTLRPCDPSLVKWYEGMLYSSKEAVKLPCTARAIIYNTLGTAYLIAAQVKKFIKGEPLMKEIISDCSGPILITQ